MINNQKDFKVEMDFYHENGYLIVRNLLNTDEINEIQEYKKRMDKEVANAKGDFQKDGASFNFERKDINAISNMADTEVRQGVLRKIQEVFFLDEMFRRVCTSDKVLDVISAIIGPKIYYHSSKLMYKGAGGRQKPWHQDFAYWSSLNSKQVTVWYAIDKATKENGCIQVVPKSHKKGLVPHFGPELQFNPNDHFKPEEIVYAEMNPGDVLFFDVLTFHYSDANLSNKDRLSMIIDFQSALGPKEWSRLKEPLRDLAHA